MKWPHYHHGNLKESLIHHGLDCLEEEGRDQLSLRDIARRAGVSHNAPYRHFEDKTALLMAIQNRVAKDLIRHIEAVPLLYPQSALMQLQSIGQLILENCISHPQRMLLFLQSIPEKQNQTDSRRLIEEAIREVISDNLQAGLLTTGDASSLARTFMAALFGYCTPFAAEVIISNKNKPSRTDYSERISQFDHITQNILHGFLP